MKREFSESLKEKIRALLATGQAKNAVAKKIGVSWATVDKVSKENPEELESLREQKKVEFIVEAKKEKEGKRTILRFYSP